MTGFWDLVPCSDSDSVNLLDEWLGASHWRFQCFEFLVSKMRVVKVLGLPKWCSGKEYACQCRRCWRCRFNPWIRKIPWWRKWQPTPLFLLGKFYGQRSLVSYRPWDRKESDMTEQLNKQQSRIRDWLAHPFSRGSSWPRNQTREAPSSTEPSLLS